MPLLRQLYAPLMSLVASLPYPYVFLAMGGVALLVATLNLRGGTRFVVILLGLYLLGGAWMVHH